MNNIVSNRVPIKIKEKLVHRETYLFFVKIINAELIPVMVLTKYYIQFDKITYFNVFMIVVFG